MDRVAPKNTSQEDKLWKEVINFSPARRMETQSPSVPGAGDTCGLGSELLPPGQKLLDGREARPKRDHSVTACLSTGLTAETLPRCSGAMEASGAPAGQAVPLTFAPGPSLASALALPVCVRVSSPAQWLRGHSDKGESTAAEGIAPGKHWDVCSLSLCVFPRQCCMCASLQRSAGSAGVCNGHHITQTVPRYLQGCCTAGSA